MNVGYIENNFIDVHFATYDALIHYTELEWLQKRNWYQSLWKNGASYV